MNETENVVEAGALTLGAVPETFAGIAREMVSGVCKLKDRLMINLDVAKTIQPG